MIYIASDHGGFKLKEHLKGFLKDNKMKFKDLGPKKFDPKDDYPDFAALVATEVSADPKNNQGILLCRSGQGMCIAANKFKGVRAALVWNVIEAKQSRQDDFSNVICLPGDFLSPELTQTIVETWLHTPWSEEARHKRRVEKIGKIELGIRN